MENQYSRRQARNLSKRMITQYLLQSMPMLLVFLYIMESHKSMISLGVSRWILNIRVTNYSVFKSATFCRLTSHESRLHDRDQRGGISLGSMLGICERTGKEEHLDRDQSLCCSLKPLPMWISEAKITLQVLTHSGNSMILSSLYLLGNRFGLYQKGPCAHTR